MGRFGYDDEYDEYQSRGRPGTKRPVLTDSEENRQRLSNGEDLGSQTGVLTG